MERSFDPMLWNAWTVSLSQACLGSISCNFRAITLSLEQEVVTLTFYLKADDPDDREDAVDIATLFEATEGRSYSFEIFIGDGPIPRPQLPNRLFVERREPR